MRAVRAIVSLLIAHCGASYMVAAWAVAISIWLGSRDYFGLLIVGAIAPLALPVMALQTVVGTNDQLFSLRAMALTLPVYALGFAITLVFWLKFAWKRARAQRISQGLCGACGYNLVGNTSGVCPECGLQVPGQTASPV